MNSRIESLLAAALAGDTTLIASILDAAPELVNQRGLLPGHTGLRTALHHAVGGDSETALALLLDRGADPNIRDQGDDATPLHFAAEKQHLGMIQRLVEHGADPVGEGTWHELDVLGWATCFGPGRRDVVDYLLAHGARWTIFSAAAMGADAEVLRLVRASRAELTRRMDTTNRRRTPLHLAVMKEHSDTALLLVELGADLTATDAAGLTPLAQAAFMGKRDLADRLLAAGSPLDVPAAIALQRIDDLARLLAADPAALEPGGRWESLIVRAAEASPAGIVSALLSLGASVDARDPSDTAVDQTSGYTPLHAAAFRGSAEVVALLMQHGADVAARESRYGATPAGWADWAGHAAVRDQILQGKVDLFDAVQFSLVGRVPEIVARDPGALERRFVEAVGAEPETARWAGRAAMTPLDLARSMELDAMVAALLGAAARG